MENEQMSGDLTDLDKLDFFRFILSVVEQEIENSRIAYANTNNPVFVWQAIRLSEGVKKSQALRGEEPPQGWGALPSWCMEYLFKCAHAIDGLCHGVDPRNGTMHRAAAIARALAVRQSTGLPRATHRTRLPYFRRSHNLKGTKNTNLVPAVLGFTKPGWNAFTQYWSIQKTTDLERLSSMLRLGGGQAGAARAEAAARYGLQDERNVRRRLRKKHRVFSWPAD